MNKQLTHGGPGRGQGRHPKPKEEKYVPFGLRLPPDVNQWLRDNVDGNKSEFIVEAIQEKIERMQ